MPAFVHVANTKGASERNPVAYDFASRSVSLPSALALTEQQVDRVCGCLFEIMSATARR
jgi:dTDP-4-amino-4,6-dideoxygalactose transaminase